MDNYIGIDLGTTNSAICSFDGQKVRIWKSPEQNDVTPSVIYYDKRGNRFYGQTAYSRAPYYQNQSASLFKRFLGTTKKINIEPLGLALTPEECSAEILKVLFSYLPEEIRDNAATAVVISVPASFNQMKKDATKQAAQMAGFANVALIQEPVAAALSALSVSATEGVFLIYDLGGGTFDVSLVDNIGGKVNLLDNSGKEHCGGRDLDKYILRSKVIPWLNSTFNLPKDFAISSKYNKLRSVANWAVEKAKIELSSLESTTIRMDEESLQCSDESDTAIYLDIPLTRSDIQLKIDEIAADTLEVIHETLNRSGMGVDDVKKIIFVGGPTNYKPLRDKIADVFSLVPDIGLNPMTAVAQGASIYAESIDWSSPEHYRKSASGESFVIPNLSFRYTARTMDKQAFLIVLTDKEVGFSLEIISVDTGWSSGRADLKNKMAFELPLFKKGENKFEIFLYDQYGHSLPIKDKNLTIVHLLADVGSIPASHSIFVEVLDRLGGSPVADFFVEKNDFLPIQGKKSFRTETALEAGSDNSINIKLWEGEIEDPISDNQFIGSFRILGTDLSEGVVPAGSEIICNFTIGDDGVIQLSAAIPVIGYDFGTKNFYSRQEGQINIDEVGMIADKANKHLKKLHDLSAKIDDGDLSQAIDRLKGIVSLLEEEIDEEDILKASADLQETIQLIAKTKKKHLVLFRQRDLDETTMSFNSHFRKYADEAECEKIDNLIKTCQQAINRKDQAFDKYISELESQITTILWRHDWFMIDAFNYIIQDANKYRDKKQFEQLRDEGLILLRNDKIDELRHVILKLLNIQTKSADSDLYSIVNIIKGG